MLYNDMVEKISLLGALRNRTCKSFTKPLLNTKRMWGPIWYRRTWDRWQRYWEPSSSFKGRKKRLFRCGKVGGTFGLFFAAGFFPPSCNSFFFFFLNGWNWSGTIDLFSPTLSSGVYLMCRQHHLLTCEEEAAVSIPFPSRQGSEGWNLNERLGLPYADWSGLTVQSVIRHYMAVLKDD